MDSLTELEDLSDICRVCLEKSSKMYPLVGPVLNVDVDISTMIIYCTGEEIELNDGDLPQGVCIPCFRTIRIAYNFICEFKETNKKLLELKESLRIQKENGNSQPASSDIIYSYNEEELDHVQEEENEDNELVNEEESVDTVSIVKCEDVDIVYFENALVDARDGADSFEASGVLEDAKLEEIDEEDVEKVVFLQPSRKKLYQCRDATDSTENVEIHVEDDAPVKEELRPAPRKKKATVKVYKCPICPKRATKFEYVFVPHLYTHQEETFTCSACTSSPEMNVDDYIIHYKRYHMYQCEICHKSFSQKSSQYYHMKCHEDNKVYACSYENCKKTFLTPWSLKKHVNTHSKSAMYICSKCGRKFNTYDTFRYHMKTHDGKRSYLCPQCGRSFLQSVHLKDHMWKHRGIKQFCCNKCEKSYTSVTQLKKHLRKYCGLEESNVERRKWPLDVE